MVNAGPDSPGAGRLMPRRVVLRTLDSMNSAFRFGCAAPSAGARVLTNRGSAGTGHASDRQETFCRERMRWQLCIPVDRLDVFARDVGERIEFQPGAVLLHHGNIRAQAALKALAAIDPGFKRRQRARQRLDLADPATGIWIGEPQFAIAVLAR